MSLLLSLPLWLYLSILFVFGIIIGSFLNVYLYRFHTGKSVNGSSHCLSCGTRLRFYELFPLLSYLALRGRCRTCGSYIPVRYFLVELLTGLAFVAVALTAPSVPLLLLMLLVIVVLIVIAVYDLYHFIIPDELVIALSFLVLVVKGYHLTLFADPVAFYADLGAAFLGTSFFFLLWQASKGKWIGFGDVKLALPLGLLVGCAGVFSMIVLSFWVGAGVGLALLAYGRLKERGKTHLRLLERRLTMKSAVPFAPFLIIGSLLVYLFQVDVIELLIHVY